MIINDVSTGQGAAVDSEGRLRGLVEVRSPLVVSAKVNEAVAVHSTYSATAADEVLYFRNDDSKNFYVEFLKALTSVAGSFTLALCTGTAGGTAVVASSLKIGSLPTRIYTAFGNAAVTGLTPGAAIGQLSCPANGADSLFFGGGVIIEPGQPICVTSNVTGVIAVTLYGYWGD